MSFLKVDSWKDVFLHLGAMLVLSLSIGYIILYIWLPSYTNHDQQIEVPNLDKMTIEEAESALSERDLKLTILDTVYRANYKPGVVHRQDPLPKSFVKENRRVYVSINAQTVPKISISPEMMKGLRLQSLDVVKSKIREYGFQEGETFTVYGKYQDYVLNTIFKGDTLNVGNKIPLGAKIDIVVSDGKAQ